MEPVVLEALQALQAPEVLEVLVVLEAPAVYCLSALSTCSIPFFLAPGDSLMRLR